MKISEIVDRMAEIKREKKALTAEFDKLQAQLQVIAECDLTDTKIKSAGYYGTNGNAATVTTSDTVLVIAGELLPKIFGSVYPSMVSERKTYTLKEPAKRILSAIWHREYCEGSVAEIIGGLNCDEKAKKALLKKLKGINFDKDKENLMNYAGLSESEASDTAYLINEAASWEQICTLIKVNNDGRFNSEILADVMNKVNSAVNVSRGIKTEIKIGGETYANGGTDE